MSLLDGAPPDYASAYREVRVHLLEVVRSRDAADLETIAPATPEWRVRDVIAHLAGICDDIVHGNMDGRATDPWTAAQVAKRRDWGLQQLIDDWNEHAVVIESQMNDWGPGMGQMVFDAFTHDQDVRGALDEPRARDGAAAEIAFSWMVPNLQPPADVSPDDPRLRPTLRLLTEVGEFDILGPRPPATAVHLSRFEFLRVITGRRSRRQIEALAWEGEPRVDDLCVGDPFHPATVDILE